MSKTTITLFFTYGVSIKTWAETGLLQREIRIYQELMQRFGIQVQFLTYGDAVDHNWESDLNGIKLLPVYERLRRPTNKFLSLLQTIIIPWTFREELKQTDLLKTNQIWGGWVAVISKWGFNKPLLVRCGYEFYDFACKMGRSRTFQFLAYWICRLIYSQADHIQVASLSDRKILEKQFNIPSNKINDRPNWIDSDVFRPLELSTNKKILFVGRMTGQKNINLILYALEGTSNSLDIVGDGDMRDDLEKLAKKLKVHVKFLGRIPNNRLPYMYNRCSVYVLCSKFEGNPKALLEAMSCGCAVIGTKVPGIRDVIRHEHTGLLVAESQKGLQEAINRLLDDDRLRNRLGERARQYILGNNSLNDAIEKECTLYQKLLNHKSVA